MDKTSIDRSVSGCPAEQMIVPKSNTDYKLGPMTELGLTLKSANEGTQPGQDNDSGAGANAGSREEMVFVTTDPLSELVWSPHKGLSLKCADCNLADKKAFLWGMMLSAPQSITIGEKNDIEPLSGGNLNSSQMVDKVTLIGSPSSTKSAIPMFQTTDPEHKLGWGEDMKDVTKKEGQPVPKINHEDDHLDKKGKRVRGPTDLQSTETSRTRIKTISSKPEKASTQGLDNAGTANSSSTKLNEEKFYLVRVNPESGDSEKGTGSDPFEGNKDVNSGNSYTAGMDTESSYKTSASKQCKLSDTQIRFLTSSSANHEGFAPVIQEEGMKKITASSSNVLEKGDSTSENEFECLKGESAYVVVGITSHPADEVKGNQCQNGVFQGDEVAFVKASPLNRILLYKKKDKEKVLFNAEVNVGIRNDDDDDSHESVESCNNSTGLNLSGKRPWTFDQNLAIGNKMMKKQTHESPHCTSVQRHGSSFMNWISNMVKGSSKSDLKEATSLDLDMRSPNHKNGSADQHFMLQERNKPSGCTSTGFGTVFKALYSGMNIPDSGIVNIDNQLVEGSKELELANKTCDDSSIPLICGGENLKICEETIISTGNQLISGDRGVSSSLPNISSASISVIQEDRKIGVVESNSLLSIPCDHGKRVQISSSSSFQNDLDSPSEEKENNKLGFSSNKSSNSEINKSHPLGSLWITRFYPKVSGLMIDSSQCKQNVDAAVEGPTECVGILSSSQNTVVSDHCKDVQEPFSEDRFDAVNKKVQNSVVSTAGCFGSITIKEHKDQKFESTKPSERFMKSEAMVSVFAKRLDALRHIMPSEVEGKTNHATTSCIYCGIRGHKLQECSYITELELDALLKKIDSYDGAGESSCWCIHCFQLNHWAIACPNISSTKCSHLDGSSSLLDFRNFSKVLCTPRRDKVTNNEESNPSDNVVCGSAVALTVSEGKKPRVDSEFRAGTNVNKKVNDMMILNRSYTDSKMTTKHLLGNSCSEGNSLKKISRQFVLDGKQTKTSSSTENVSKEYPITAFYNFVNRQIPAIPRRTFEAVKKLRFSRTDIFKWRRSPVSLFPLEGYFVRLRLQKWEKELGGTGYYVARINGGFREKSYGSSKVVVSVKIGGFKCLVESRFVSNHDFLEDELLAWWCAILKGGGIVPSEKDLEMKLEERKGFGF